MRRPNRDSMMLYGLAPVHEALRAGRRVLHRLHLREGKLSPQLQSLDGLAKRVGVAVERASTHALGNLAATRHHQGAVLECGPLPRVELAELLAAEPQLLVALDQVTDPQNLGSIARSALFFGAAGLLSLTRRSAPLSAAASKASAGALEVLPIAELTNLAAGLRSARESGMRVLGAANQDEALDLGQFRPDGPVLLVLGAEDEGLRELTRRNCDQLLRIEGGGMESLNVGVAAGILLHHLRSSQGFRSEAAPG